MTGEKQQVELEWEVEEGLHGKVFRLVGGPTGYESFYIDFDGKCDTRTGLMKKKGWCACMGDVGFKFPRYDKLVIPAEEMAKAFKELEA